MDSVSACSDPSVMPPEGASETNKELWWLHGHPHSSRYSNPGLTSLAALIRYGGMTYGAQPGFLYPAGPEGSHESLSWTEFDEITENLAACYAQNLREELEDANRTQMQPSVALLGGGHSIEYFCTQMGLVKLGIRVLLLAESNSVAALHHLLDTCDVSVVITDAKNARVEMQQVRKVKMIEVLPRHAAMSSSCVDSVRFRGNGDVWEHHTFIIHSSGSTGLPKPIIHTNRSMMLIARMYRLFQDFEAQNWFLLFPLYHIAGISIALSGLPNGQILSFPPRFWPPSSSAIFTALRQLSKWGSPVDVVHCAPSLIENMHEYILEQGKDFTPLASLKVLQPGGAELSPRIVRDLVANGVNVKSTYGSTEIGPPFRTIPHTKENPNCYLFRNLYPDNDKVKMEEIGDGLYECVVYKGWQLAAELWNGRPDNEPYRTNDIFVQDPPGSGLFILKGRRDDILVHTNGENTSAGALQLEVQSSSKIIRRTLAVGHSQPCVALLVEIHNQHDPESDDVMQEVWETVKQVNKLYPAHSRIMRSMIHIIPRGLTLPVTPKSNVRRKEAEKIFANEIARLYGTINDRQVSQDWRCPLKEYIRIAFAKLVDVSPKTIEDRTTLYELGIDSRMALSLRQTLSRRTEIGPISISAIFENPSINCLIKFIQGREQTVMKESRSEVVNQITSRLTAQISTWPPRVMNVHYNHPKTETILLTGASGSLGASLLESLSRSPRVCKIYAVVRGHERRKRLYQSLLSRGLDADAILKSGKIEVLNYNMQDPLLGLDIEEYAQLAQNATIIIHNAWKMDFNQRVEYFEHECIASTMSLLRLSCVGRPKTFAFVSSISTCLASPAGTIPETPNIGPPSIALNTGYAQSKYIIERLTLSAASYLHIPIRLLRVGQLSGDTRTGHWNRDELWPILFATCAKLGKAPDFPMKAVDWIPVNVAGQSIVEILTQLQSPNSLPSTPFTKVDPDYTIHNIVNPHRIPWQDVITMLQNSDIAENANSMRQISIVEWVALLTAAADEGVSSEDLPALRLLSFFQDMAASAQARKEKSKSNSDDETSIVFENAASRTLSPALAACEPYQGKWLNASIRKWRNDGFTE